MREGERGRYEGVNEDVSRGYIETECGRVYREGMSRGYVERVLSCTLMIAPSSHGESVRLKVLLSISLNSAGVSSEASKPFRPGARGGVEARLEGVIEGKREVRGGKRGG